MESSKPLNVTTNPPTIHTTTLSPIHSLVKPYEAVKSYEMYNFHKPPNETSMLIHGGNKTIVTYSLSLLTSSGQS